MALQVEDSLTVSAVLDNLTPVSSRIQTALKQRGCPSDSRYKVAVALEELFVNVCSYAYADRDGIGDVTVTCEYREDPPAVSIELRDTGIPFDPVTRRDPTRPTSVEDMPIGGLGIFMVRKTMDSFTYRREDGMNVVRFSKSW